MAAVGCIVLTMLALILIGLGIALMLPVRLRFHATTEGEPGFVAYVRAFGGMTPEVRLGRNEKSKFKQKKRANQRKRSSKLKWISALPKLIVDLLANVSIECLSVRGVFGFQDPADTGQAFGLMTPAIYALTPRGRCVINVEPRFDGLCLLGELDATLSFTPLRLILPISSYLWRAFGYRA